MKPPRHDKPKDHHTRENRVCRYCGGKLEGRRVTFCSDPCVHEWRMRSDPGYARAQVHRRDLGVCAECGLDCDGLLESLAQWQRRRADLYEAGKTWNPRRWRWNPGNRSLNRAISQGLLITTGLRFRTTNPNGELARAWSKGKAAEFASIDAMRLMLRLGFPPHRQTLWDVDHIVPVKDGGGMCGLDNLRTLCYPCHARKTFAKAEADGQDSLFEASA